jgi:hypothetical protein
MGRSLRKDNKGQVIVITALLIGLLMFSTVVYVTEVIKQAPTIEARQFDMFPQYQQNLRHTLISALANITNGGNTQVLTQDIDKLNQIFISHFYESTLQIDCALANTVPYQNGLWISGDLENHVVIGAQANYQLYSLGSTRASNVVGNVNVTSEAYLSGNYVQIDQTTKQATLTLRVLNEGTPALASEFQCYYQNGSQWNSIQTSDSTDFGNGTYKIVFSVNPSEPSDQLTVSIKVIDQRDINMRVKVTCTSQL